MIILSTGDIPCPECSARTPAGLLEIRDMTVFMCPQCGRSSDIDVTRFAHDIAMYEWAQRQFGGDRDADE